jgi:hypothetical protein
VLCTAFVSVSARTQDSGDAVARLVAADATALVTHPDALVRGEAALVLAARHEPTNHERILTVAKDGDPRAQVRGLLALGQQATPGVADVLADQLADAGKRTSPTGLAAAYALGSLPPDHAPTLVTELLTSFLQTSWRRQHDVLLALLLGMQGHAQAPQRTALRRLFDEESNRDPQIRALLLRLLLPIDPELDAAQLRRVLDRGSEPERLALVGWLATHQSPADADLQAPIERLAKEANRAELRTQALAALTRMRHLPALELAAKALGSRHPAEAAQGLESALQIGGRSLRGALERHLCAETDPELATALLRAWSAPPSAALADHCARLASDRARPLPLRSAAALTLARADAERAAPLLRDLFREADDPRLLGELACVLMQGPAADAPLQRLMHGPTDLRQHPERWTALLEARHPEAVRQLLQNLHQSPSGADGLGSALRAWREATTNLTPAVVAALPESLALALRP